MRTTSPKGTVGNDKFSYTASVRLELITSQVTFRNCRVRLNVPTTFLETAANTLLTRKSRLSSRYHSFMALKERKTCQQLIGDLKHVKLLQFFACGDTVFSGKKSLQSTLVYIIKCNIHLVMYSVMVKSWDMANV